MKIKTYQNLSNIETLQEYIRFASAAIGDIITEINGRLSFQENMQAQTLVVELPASGQQIGVPHGLGFVPNGYLVIKRNAAVTVYDGATENTKETIYFRSTGAGQATVLVF